MVNEKLSLVNGKLLKKKYSILELIVLPLRTLQFQRGLGAYIVGYGRVML